MNVLELERKDFVRDSIELKSLKPILQKVEFFQDFIYLPIPNGGIIILKDKYDIVGKGFFFAP